MSFTYFLKRAAFAALALAALMTSAFFLVRLTGDPVDLYLPVDASSAAREAMRVRLGLDASLPAQFLDWAWDMIRLDFGMSLWHNRPAMDVVLEALPNTLALGAIALTLAFVAAIVIGSIAAVNAGGWIDRGVNVLSQAAASVPDFWLGLMG